jgi:hypothetical protein
MIDGKFLDEESLFNIHRYPHDLWSFQALWCTAGPNWNILQNSLLVKRNVEFK